LSRKWHGARKVIQQTRATEQAHERVFKMGCKMGWMTMPTIPPQHLGSMLAAAAAAAAVKQEKKCSSSIASSRAKGFAHARCALCLYMTQTTPHHNKSKKN